MFCFKKLLSVMVARNFDNFKANSVKEDKHYTEYTQIIV